MQSLVSTQMVEYAFMLTWCFKNRLPVCVNAAYSSLLICELEPVFAFCLYPKLYRIHEHFQHPAYAHFIMAGM